jgi:hypothetical protein
LKYIHKRPDLSIRYASNREGGFLRSHQTRFTNPVPLTPLHATLTENTGGQERLRSSSPTSLSPIAPDLQRHLRRVPTRNICEEPQPPGIVPECQARLLRSALVFTPFAGKVRDACRLSESESRHRFRLFCVRVQPAARRPPPQSPSFAAGCFSWRLSSPLAITPGPQPYWPIRPKSRPRSTVAPPRPEWRC